VEIIRKSLPYSIVGTSYGILREVDRDMSPADVIDFDLPSHKVIPVG
jgi:hypothetical protein